MRSFYDAVYLSPHLDDAALSCGGQIFDLTRAGKAVLVVTIMAGEPAARRSSEYADSLHRRWGLESEVATARRAEDMAACKVLGADWQHWEFLDCIYRVEAETGRPLYTSDEAIFGEIDAADAGLAAALAERMALLPACRQVFSPLTLGHHVDHQITRRAAERCFSAANLVYYEDYPYAREFSAEQFVADEPGRWRSRVIELTEAGTAARIRAVKCFRSQISSFFKNEHDLEEQLRAFTKNIGGERVWMVAQD